MPTIFDAKVRIARAILSTCSHGHGRRASCVSCIQNSDTGRRFVIEALERIVANALYNKRGSVELQYGTPSAKLSRVAGADDAAAGTCNCQSAGIG